MVSRRLLLVTYPYPPMPSVGANRWLAMRSHLRRMGHEVTTVTTAAFGGLDDDGEELVHRAPDLISAGWLRRAFRRGTLPKDGGAAAVDRAPGRMITDVVVPDPYVVTWAPAAVRAAARIVARERIDCVITTSAYDSTHLVALGLGSRRPAWIADFRDGWTFDPVKQRFPTGPQRRLDSWLERRVVTGADRVVSAIRPVADDFRSRLGVDAAYVPNGWDPDLEDQLGDTEAPALDDSRCNLVHTGTMTGPWGRSPGPLLDALAALSAEGETRLRLVLAGRLTIEEKAMIERPDLAGVVQHVGQLSRAGAMALQRRADALVLITSPRTVSELSGKIFEYFGAGRPILALAGANEAARVVAETRTGWAIPADNVTEIKAALRRAAAGELQREFAPTGLEAYVYPAPAERMAAEIERAIDRRKAAA